MSGLHVRRRISNYLFCKCLNVARFDFTSRGDVVFLQFLKARLTSIPGEQIDSLNRVMILRGVLSRNQ